MGPEGKRKTEKQEGTNDKADTSKAAHLVVGFSVQVLCMPREPSVIVMLLSDERTQLIHRFEITASSEFTRIMEP